MTNSVKTNGPSSSDMEYYYKSLYPFKHIFNWLNHSPKPSRDMINREFAMAFRSGAYKRYNSFNSVQDFKAQIERANPDRFEIGAIYNKPPRERDTLLKSELKALEKELVFDIDMDDYDAFRTCCSGAQVCSKCWKFISLAMKIMNTALTEDFGYKDFIWVFSGRRGAHCWVSDKRARALTDVQRRNVLDYVNVIRDKNTDKRLALKRPYHPHLARSLEQLKPFFVSIMLEEQNPWEDDQHAIQTLLPALYDKQLIDSLKKYWLDNPRRSSKEKWNDIDQIATSLFKGPKQDSHIIKLRECKEDLVLMTLYPKLDVEVTKQTIHLLKAPFCIHPATGNVCVPIDESFAPEKAPKLIDLQTEMEKNNDVSLTALQPFINQFQAYVSSLLKNELGSVKRERENDDEPASLDF
ncbi:CEI_1a_G0027110.mRNA.1.CDS.1 [Saccharomyces cerevisiae]|nr:CEI_1a_G0027110.mRNA.1.CDS.1 [Saccharomyces cerevisiae]CAI7245466.1 CEI_1a_G0027110.mRNA.1.CDS.1 [Saccharomyces cerevisiae]